MTTPTKSRCDACGAAYNGCPMHRAAPALVAALELIERSTQFNGGTFPAELQQIARAALALAKGE